MIKVLVRSLGISASIARRCTSVHEKDGTFIGMLISRLIQKAMAVPGLSQPRFQQMQVDLIIVQSSAGTLARTCRHNYFLERLEIRGIFVASCGKGLRSHCWDG